MAVAAATHHLPIILIIHCLGLHLLAHELPSASRLHFCEEPGGLEKTPTCVLKCSSSHWKLCSRCQKQRCLAVFPTSGLMLLNGHLTSSELLYKGEYSLCVLSQWAVLKDDCQFRFRFNFYKSSLQRLLIWLVICLSVCVSVHQCSVNIFKTLKLWDDWANIDDTWRVYSVGPGKKCPGIRISNFSPCAMQGHPELTPVNFCHYLYCTLHLQTCC